MGSIRRRMMASREVAATLELSPDTVSIPWDGSGTYVVNVTSNTTWDIVV